MEIEKQRIIRIGRYPVSHKGFSDLSLRGGHLTDEAIHSRVEGLLRPLQGLAMTNQLPKSSLQGITPSNQFEDITLRTVKSLFHC